MSTPSSLSPVLNTRQGSTSKRPKTAPSRPSTERGVGRAPLARYTSRHGRPREVIVRHGLAGSVLVVDRDAVSHGDCLLVAHLCADEPPENARLVCTSYLADMRNRRMRCRSLSEIDAVTSPLPDELTLAGGPGCEPGEISIARDGYEYRLEAVPMGMSIPALRWCRTSRVCPEPDVVSLRQAIAALEAYEPLRTSTVQALASHQADTALSTAVLGAELSRVQESPIVLNRRLREVVLAAMRAQGMSMSEMAIRCGRVKRDSKGNESGETSWLARRLGLLAESGQPAPTPWIHTDVLALIARRGLGLSPREVEVS
jgi:hypothetical protein